MPGKPYNRKVTNYGSGHVEVVAYATPQLHLRNIMKPAGSNPEPELSDEAQARRTQQQIYSIRRRIKGYALSNDFEWFATLTIDPEKKDSMNYLIAKDTLLKWCRWMRDRYGAFDYLIIPEFHKSGAVHFHALLGEIPARFVEATSAKTGRPVIREGRQVYNLKDWDYGFSDLEKVENPDRTASYITKYITKQLLTGKDMFQQKRYFCSKGLKRPKVKFELTDDDKLEKFVPNYGVVETDKNGKNHLFKGIYQLEVDSENGGYTQPNSDYVIKAKKMNHDQNA